MELSFNTIKQVLSPLNLKSIDATAFKQLLNSVPVGQRHIEWPKITPSILERLPQALHEVLLDRLPQAGAIKDRKPGTLRVLSLGFHVHIAGTNPDCPYPFDFFVRINGQHGVMNIMLQPRAPRFKPELLAGIDSGPTANFFEVMQHLAKRGFQYIDDYELIVLKMWRPGCPNGWHWTTVAGVFEPGEEQQGPHAARTRACQEIKEEFTGYEVYGWASLISSALYQPGNISELQHVSVTIGHIPDPQKIRLGQEEGIVEWHPVILDHAQGFLRGLKRVPSRMPHCILADEKMAHGLAVLLQRLGEEIGIVKK